MQQEEKNWGGRKGINSEGKPTRPISMSRSNKFVD
jgi:hypothetical protein